MIEVRLVVSLQEGLVQHLDRPTVRFSASSAPTR